MMKFITTAATLALCVVSSSANSLASSSASSSFSSPQTHLNNARWTFDFEHSGNYDFSYTRRDGMIFHPQCPYTVQVRGGVVDTTLDCVGNIVIDPNSPTIDDLFDEVQDAITWNLYQVIVHYDEWMGYPSSIYIDHYENVANDDTDITIYSFSVAPMYDAETVRAELDQARQAWASGVGTDYLFAYENHCMMCYYSNFPWSIWVADGVADAVDSTGYPVDPATIYQEVPTIEDIFQHIENALLSNAHEISVTYSTYGYPEHVFIDYDHRIMDEEYMVQINDIALP